MDPKCKLLISAGFLLAIPHDAALAGQATEGDFISQMRAAQAVIKSTRPQAGDATDDGLKWRTGWRNWGDWNNGGWKNWDDFKNS